MSVRPSPRATQGRFLDICTKRFIHPGDSNWRDSRRGIKICSLLGVLAKFILVFLEHPYIPRAPLAAQSYAFRRHQRELSGSPGRYRDGRLATETVKPSKLGNRDPQMNFRRGEASRRHEV